MTFNDLIGQSGETVSLKKLLLLVSIEKGTSSNVADALMFKSCKSIPNLQCVCATQPFLRDDARKKSAKTQWSGHTPKS